MNDAADYDGAWKDLIESSTPELLERLLNDLYRDADLNKKPVFRDKELRDLIKADEHEPTRFVDELISVPLKSGRERWVLLHVEIQAHGGEDISRRMMQYCALILAHYKRVPVALAILTERRPRGETPGIFEAGQYGTRLRYEYNCFKLYEQDAKALLSSGNIFDVAFYAAKVALTCKRDEERKYKYVSKPMRVLYQRGYTREQRVNFIKFIASVVNPRDELHIKKLQDESEELSMQEATMLEKVWGSKGYLKGVGDGEPKWRAAERRDIVKQLCTAMDVERIAQILNRPVAEIEAIAKSTPEAE